MSLLDVQNLKKIYIQGEQSIKALDGVSLSLEKGEFVSVMGPSGSGKSTFLHLVGGLDRPSSGDVLIDQKNIAMLNDHDLSIFRRRKLGFIFQFFNLLPTLSALENVALPLLLDGQSISQITPKAQDLLEEMGMKKRIHHYPDQLSGGEMQRVAIARALVTDPVIILADEPTGNLDSSTGAKVLEILANLSKHKNQTIMMVTHDPRAASFGNRLIHFKDGCMESDSQSKH